MDVWMDKWIEEWEEKDDVYVNILMRTLLSCEQKYMYAYTKNCICYRQSLVQADLEGMYSKRKEKKKESQ